MQYKYEVDIITYNKFNKKFYYKFQINGCTVHAFNMRHIEKFSNKLNNLILLPAILFFLLKRLKYYDIFHFHGLFALDYYILYVVKKFSCVKTVWTNHTSRFLELYKQKKNSDNK